MTGFPRSFEAIGRAVREAEALEGNPALRHAPSSSGPAAAVAPASALGSAPGQQGQAGAQGGGQGMVDEAALAGAASMDAPYGGATQMAIFCRRSGNEPESMTGEQGGGVAAAAVDGGQGWELVWGPAGVAAPREEMDEAEAEVESAARRAELMDAGARARSVAGGGGGGGGARVPGLAARVAGKRRSKEEGGGGARGAAEAAGEEEEEEEDGGGQADPGDALHEAFRHAGERPPPLQPPCEPQSCHSSLSQLPALVGTSALCRGDRCLMRAVVRHLAGAAGFSPTGPIRSQRHSRGLGPVAIPSANALPGPAVGRAAVDPVPSGFADGKGEDEDAF
jgi:hypothetical protein